MTSHEIKCAVCHETVVGFIELAEGQEYPGDENCSLVCDPCIALQFQSESIDFAKREANIQSLNNYMNDLMIQGQISQANVDLFLSDTSALVQQYLGGGGRLITWVETVNRNGYNATTIGFKTRTAYRGTLVNGLYPRAEMILSILNNL